VRAGVPDAGSVITVGLALLAHQHQPELSSAMLITDCILDCSSSLCKWRSHRTGMIRSVIKDACHGGWPTCSATILYVP